MPWRFIPSFFFSPTLSVVPFLELRTRREVSPPYAHRRASRSNLLLPLLCWIWSSEVVIYSARAWNYEALHGWRWEYDYFLYTTLRSASSASSTTLVWERDPRFSVYKGMYIDLLRITISA